MNQNAQDRALENQIRQALGSPAKADFENWRNQYGDALACLNPQTTVTRQHTGRLAMRITSATVAATVLLGVIAWTLVPKRVSFAEVIKGIDEAQTITWAWTTYTRVHSEDGKRTWLTHKRIDFAYQAPGLYRHTSFGDPLDDDAGEPLVTIVDARSGRALSLDMKRKKARFHGPESLYDPEGPFGWVSEFLKTKSPQLVGQRNVDGKPVDVFRHHRSTAGEEGRTSSDIWIDPRTRQLVGFSEPGADVFDPETENSPAEEKWSRAEPVGSITRDIVFNATLDEDLFSLTPPDGFEVVVDPKRLSVSEADLVEWLRVMARFNNDTFVDTTPVTEDRRLWAMMRKDVAERSDVETELSNVFFRHWKNGNIPLIPSFCRDNTVGDSFRFAGKGVKLGSDDRVVCWYELKSTGEYRAVFGDLTIKNVDPKDLPQRVDQ